MIFQCGGMSVDMGVKHHSAANVQEVHQESLVKPKFTMAHFGNPMVCLDFPSHKGPKHGFIGSFSDTAIGLQTQAWTTMFEMGVGKPRHQIVRNLGFSHFQGPCQTLFFRYPIHCHYWVRSQLQIAALWRTLITLAIPLSA